MDLSVSGLASGLDSKTLIAQLMSIERRPQARLKLQQTQAEARKSALSDISTKLGSLKSAALALRASTTWADSQTVESSNTAVLGVKRISGAGPGGYAISVQQLASAEQRTYTYTPSGAAGTLTIGSTTIDVAANATLQNVVDAVNSNGSAPVYA